MATKGIGVAGNDQFGLEGRVVAYPNKTMKLDEALLETVAISIRVGYLQSCENVLCPRVDGVGI
jgi:hypothetical protein